MQGFDDNLTQLFMKKIKIMMVIYQVSPTSFFFLAVRDLSFGSLTKIRLLYATIFRRVVLVLQIFYNRVCIVEK